MLHHVTCWWWNLPNTWPHLKCTIRFLSQISNHRTFYRKKLLRTLWNKQRMHLTRHFPSCRQKYMLRVRRHFFMYTIQGVRISSQPIKHNLTGHCYRASATQYNSTEPILPHKFHLKASQRSQPASWKRSQTKNRKLN